jgi:large subunit ribosomal protein L25
MPALSNTLLTLESRATTGTTHARSLRRNGKIPGILFGHGAPSLPITLNARALDDIIHACGKSHLLTITIDGKTQDTALLRDLQRDPVTHRITHADLQRISATESTNAKLPIAVVGTPEGAKQGGVLDVLLHYIEVRGPVNALPETLEIDVTALRIHDHIIAAQVKLPATFTILTPPETIIITIEAPRTAVEAAPAAPPAAEVPTVAQAKSEGKTDTK